MKSRQRSYYSIGFVLTILLISAFLTVGYQNLRRSEIESKKVESALESLHVLEDILDDMQDLESNQRGFIITGDSSFLIEFENLIGKSKKDLAKLARFAKTDSLYSSNALHLTVFVNKKFSFSKKTVALKSENHTEEAEKLVQSGAGKQFMDSIRKYTILLTNLDREFLKQANEGEAKAARNMNLLFTSLSGAFVLIFSLLFFIIRRDARKHKKYQAEIDHLASLVEQTSDAIISIDLNGTILSWNEGAAKMLGYPRQEAMGRSISEMTGKGLHVLQVKLMSEELKAQGQMNAETLNYDSKGRPVYCLASATTIRNRQGTEKGYVVILNDITSKKETEKLLYEFNQELARQVDEKTEQIRKSEERYRSLIEQASDAIFVNDLSGNIIEVNSKACQLLGQHHDDICSWNVTDLFAKEELDQKPIMQKELLAGDTTFVERNILRKDGKTIPVEITARMATDNRIMAIVRDITDRKETEARLKASEKDLRNVLSSMADVFYVIDKNFRITSINETAIEMLSIAWGKPVANDMNLLELIPVNSDEPILESFEKVFNGERIEYELKNHIPGLPQWVSVTFRPVRGDCGAITGACVTTKDISERKKAEEALHHSNERFELIARTTNDAVWEWNLETNEVWGNEMHQALYGLTPHDPAPSHQEWMQHIHADDRDQVIQSLEQTLASNENVWMADYRFLRNDHEPRYIFDRTYIVRNEAGKPVRMMGVMMDITDRKHFEEMLKKEKYLSDSILNSLPGIFYLFDENGKYLRWNKNLEHVSGYDENEIAAMQPLDFFDSGQKDIVRMAIKKTFDEGMAEVEAILSTKDGAGIPYYFNGWRIMFEGKPCLIGIGMDTTERKKAEEQIRSTTEQLRRLSAHLQNVREEERIFIAREIHDELGQQLTVLKLDVSRLNKSISPEHTELKQQGESVLQLVNETISSVRRISSQLRPGMLDDLGLAAAIEWHAQEFEKRTGIKTVVSIVQHELALSRQADNNLFRIFQEALTNVARHAHASEVNVLLGVENSELLLSIADNGVGFNTKEAEQKATLGLLGIRERTSALGGVCSIITASGKGTTLEIVIPIENNQ